MKDELKEKTMAKIGEIYDNAMPEDKDYLAKLNVAARLQANVNELEKIESQEAINQSEKETGNKDRLVRFLEVGVTAVLSVVSVILTQVRFNRATRKEFDEPIVGVANRTEVQEDLRDSRDVRKFKLF